MGTIAEAVSVAVIGERIVVGGVESRQMGQQMGDEPMELGEIADRALRQFERVVAHFGFEPVAPWATRSPRFGSTLAAGTSCQSGSTSGRGYERLQRPGDTDGERGERSLVVDASLFKWHVGSGLVERHGFESRLVDRCRWARESTRRGTSRCR